MQICFAFGRPSCGRALRCIGAPNLQTCGRALRCVWAPKLRTCLVLRLGAHLADVPCVALGCPTFVRPYLFLSKICSYPSSSSSLSLVLPCVDVFIADEFCVWETILRTCLALRWGVQLADVLTCLALRMCLAFALQTCIGATNLRMCLALHWGTQLALVSRVAFGCPSCGRALHCIGAPNLGEAVLKSLPPS